MAQTHHPHPAAPQKSAQHLWACFSPNSHRNLSDKLLLPQRPWVAQYQSLGPDAPRALGAREMGQGTIGCCSLLCPTELRARREEPLGATRSAPCSCRGLFGTLLMDGTRHRAKVQWGCTCYQWLCHRPAQAPTQERGSQPRPECTARHACPCPWLGRRQETGLKISPGLTRGPGVRAGTEERQ